MSGTFDDANKDKFWTAIHASNLPFFSDHLSLVKNRFLEPRMTLHFEPLEGGITATSDSCFVYRIKTIT